MSSQLPCVGPEGRAHPGLCHCVPESLIPRLSDDARARYLATMRRITADPILLARIDALEAEAS